MLGSKINKRIEDMYLKKYYSSIKEMPVIKWISLYDTHDLSYISKTGNICKRAYGVFEKLQDEIIDNFGVSKEYLAYHNLKIELELLEAEKMRTDDRVIQFEIDVAEMELEKLNDTPIKKRDMYDTIVWMKQRGISFNEDTLTIFWYYKYLQFLANQSKQEASSRKAQSR